MATMGNGQRAERFTCCGQEALLAALQIALDAFRVCRVQRALLTFHLPTVAGIFHDEGDGNRREVLQIGKTADDAECSKDAVLKLAIECQVSGGSCHSPRPRNTLRRGGYAEPSLGDGLDFPACEVAACRVASRVVEASGGTPTGT